jgi:DinB superfamily
MRRDNVGTMKVFQVQGSLSARALLRWQFRVAHRLLEDTVQQLTTKPVASFASAWACYAHAVLCEDLSVNGILATGTPLAFSTWAGHTGVSEMPSLVEPTDWRGWARQVRLNLIQLRPYARAVYASTEAYLDALPDHAIGRANEMPMRVLTTLVLTLSMRRGEIASLHPL